MKIVATWLLIFWGTIAARFLGYVEWELFLIVISGVLLLPAIIVVLSFNLRLPPEL